jgi:hypothetical protein
MGGGALRGSDDDVVESEVDNETSIQAPLNSNR